MIQLRQDQMRVVEELRASLRDHQSVLLQAPCGFGKTVVSAYIAAGAQAKRKRVLFGVHRRELARQTALTFDKFGIQYGYIMSGAPANPFAPVQIVSADTIRRRPNLIPCDLFVPDEAHLWGDATRAEIIETAMASGAHIVPLTATPARGDGKPLSRIAHKIVTGPSVRQLIDNRALASYLPISPVRPDLSGLRTIAGEFHKGDVDAMFGERAVIAGAVENYKKFAYRKRMIGYVTSRKRGEEYAAEFNARDIPAAFIDGETPDEIRRNVINGFADGRIWVLFNCQLFREGFDLSAQVGRDVPIQAVGLYNPTKSLPLAIQMMMRGMRPQDGVSVILDHAGIMARLNEDGHFVLNHGFPDDDREWSLEGQVGAKKSGERLIPTATCERCFAVFRIAPCCPYCGHSREVAGRELIEVEAEMAELDPVAIRARQLDEARAAEFARRDKRRAEGMAKTIPELAAIAKERGFKAGWVAHKLKSRGVTFNFNDIVKEMRR